jgi:hypothetical protein
MKKTYKAVAFAYDGDYITEGEHATIKDAWERINDWGSRWYFYPWAAVADDGGIIADACDDIGRVVGMTLQAAKKYIAEHTEEREYTTTHKYVALKE